MRSTERSDRSAFPKLTYRTKSSSIRTLPGERAGATGALLLLSLIGLAGASLARRLSELSMTPTGLSMNQPSHADETGLPLSRIVGLILGPLLLLLVIVLPAPGSMANEAWLTLGLLLLMATWWSTEAIPIPATALLPIVLVPALGLGTVAAATTPYANPIIFLFMGGFVLGLAMQRWNLHRRIALMTLLAVGSQPKRQIGGFMIATAFLSMWVSNTATTIMMMPIGLSVVAMLDQNDPEAVRRFATSLLLAIAYAASIGGIATLIGTPPNALLAAYLAESQDIQIGFAQWMLIGVPISALMLLLTWWWLARADFGLGETCLLYTSDAADE